MPADAQATDSPIRQGAPGKSEARARPVWRDAIAGGLYRTGAIRVVEAVARRFELQRNERGARVLVRRAAHPKFLVLCYHRIGTDGIPLFSELPPGVFEAQMRYVRRKYRVLSLDQLCEEMEKPSHKEDAVAVTFDDGYRDLHTHALPILKKYQIPAAIYLPIVSIETGQVPWYDRIFLALRVFPKNEFEIVLDRPRTFRLDSYQARLEAAAEIIQYLRSLPDERRKEYCSSLEERVTLPEDELKDRMLTWEQIRSMCRDGITFGSHTMSHPAVSQLTKSQLQIELGESKRTLEERIGRPAVHFAYPFGKPADCGTAAMPVLRGNGYRSAVTTVEGINEPGDNPFELRRSQVVNERSISMFAFKLNQLFFTSGSEDSTSRATELRPVLEERAAESGQKQPRATNA